MEIKVEGAGKVIGVGSGNGADLESFQSTSRKVFNGLLLAIVQATDKAGKISCKIESEGLVGAQVEVDVKK